MSIESIPVSSFMTSNVKTETEDQNIHAICKTMNENNIGSIIIMTDLNSTSQRAVGIVTERRYCTHIRTTPTHFITMPIKELMSKPLITLSPNSSVKDAIQTMQQNNIRRIPIVEKGNMLGIVTDKDIFRALMHNRVSLDSITSDSSLAEGHRLVFDQCIEYFFNDVLQRPKR
jgi:CBS domain-containing protein